MLLLALSLTSSIADARWLILEEPGQIDSHDVLDIALNAAGEPFDVMTGAQVAALTSADLFATGT